ncbi:hypothetical protein C2S51_013983 [Perilla frutescens var. frutescens]|nr:hypothetical protein C2S51_013983 [Perilla frutescens var. frutescens]
MVFWCRLRQSRFKFHAFSEESKRFYNLNPAPVLANQYISSSTLLPILNYPKLIVQDEQLTFYQNVRYYAKSVKVKQKAVERDPSEPRLNEEIMAPTVRLVIDEDNHCLVPRQEALARAESLNLDLVEVDKNGKPPVCKIFDYNKQKYLQQTKEKERAKSKSTLKPGGAKEIRFGGKIKQNDLKIKADMARRLMEKGHRVKCTATDSAEDVDLKKLLSQFTDLIDDVAVVESEPKYEKKQAFVVVRHVKFGPPNKGSGKKASVADSSQTREDSDEDARTNKSEWAAFDGDDGNAHPIFDIDDEESGQLESSKQKIPSSVDRNPVSPYTASSIPSEIPKPAMGGGSAKDPRLPYPPGIGMNGRGATNTMNSVPTVRGQGNQPDSSHSSNPNSPPKSYGIFSVPKVNPAHQKQNPPPPAANRYQQNVPPDSARNPRTTGPLPQRESPAADSRTSRGVGTDNPGQGRWGIFSADMNKNQAQKR